MFRKDLIEMLVGNPMGVTQIARPVKESPGRVADDMPFIPQPQAYGLQGGIEPARCRACGFEFSEKITKPSKCPGCHSTGVLEPKIGNQKRS